MSSIIQCRQGPFFRKKKKRQHADKQTGREEQKKDRYTTAYWYILSQWAVKLFPELSFSKFQYAAHCSAGCSVWASTLAVSKRHAFKTGSPTSHRSAPGLSAQTNAKELLVARKAVPCRKRSHIKGRQYLLQGQPRNLQPLPLGFHGCYVWAHSIVTMTHGPRQPASRWWQRATSNLSKGLD